MILAAALFGASQSATVTVPQEIIDSLPDYPCSGEPHMDFQEEGIYQYCDQGYIYLMQFIPENEEDCSVYLYGGNQQIYGVEKYCSEGVQFFYDEFEDELVQTFFDHFGITVEESRRKKH